MDCKPLSRPRRPRNGGTRYAKLTPGERIQMDTCKIAPAVYQYTAIGFKMVVRSWVKFTSTRIQVFPLFPGLQPFGAVNEKNSYTGEVFEPLRELGKNILPFVILDSLFP
jgi:hypothetical protein